MTQHVWEPLVEQAKHAAKAVADGAGDAVAMLIQPVAERQEESASYRSAKEEFKHEMDFHKGDFNLDKVQASYHPTPQQLHKPDAQSLKPDNEESEHRFIPEDRDSQVSFGVDGRPSPTQSLSTPLAGQTPAVLFGGPPVASDIKPTTALDSPGHTHAHGVLLGGPPVPPDLGLDLSVDPISTNPSTISTSHTSTTSSHTLPPGGAPAHQHTQGVHQVMGTQQGAGGMGDSHALSLGVSHPVYGAEDPGGDILGAPEVSSLWVGPDMPQGVMTQNGTAVSTGAGAQQQHDFKGQSDAVIAETQVPIQQSIADVTDAPLPPLQPGAQTLNLGPVVEAVRPAVDQVIHAVSQVVHTVVDEMQKGILHRHPHEHHEEDHDHVQHHGHHMHEGSHARSRM